MRNLSHAELLEFGKQHGLSSGITAWLRQHRYDLRESIQRDDDGSWLLFLSPRLLPDEQDAHVYTLRRIMWWGIDNVYERIDLTLDEKKHKAEQFERTFANSVRPLFLALIKEN